MSIQYKTILKRNPRKPEESKYYIQPIHKGVITQEEIEEALVRQTTQSRAEIRGILAFLSDFISDKLSQGHSVKLDEVGTFSMWVQSKGEKKRENVNVKNIMKLSVGFRAALEFMEKLKKARFLKA